MDLPTVEIYTCTDRRMPYILITDAMYRRAMSDIEECVSMLSGCAEVVVLTGAGISAESGIPTFRGRGGLWERYDPERLATREGFENDPRMFWEWYDLRRREVSRARPNPGHTALVRMEEVFRSVEIVTQNIDGLHALAGSSRIIELHGNIWRVRCRTEGRVFELKDVPLESIPPLCERCGSILRPDVVLFGEMLPPDAIRRAYDLSAGCDAMFVVGTSAVVHPAASLPLVAKNSGSLVVEVNPEVTPVTGISDITFRGSAAAVLPEIVERLARSR